MRRSALKWVLVVLELNLGVGGLYGGWALLSDPRGAPLRMVPGEVLANSPFDTFLVPGLILFAVNGIFPLVVVLGEMLRMPWARWGHVAVGLGLTGWMLGQVVLVGLSTPFQLTYLVMGLVILALALAALNREPPRHQGPGGRLAHG